MPRPNSQNQEINDGGLHALAASYVIGALDEAELAAFEAHLKSGCAACEAEIGWLRGVTDEMAEATAADPPAGLKARLMSKVKFAPKAPGVLVDHAGLLIARSKEMPWQPFAPGVEMKPLFVDETRRYATTLVRMEAGAHYGSHLHHEAEELFVLSGDLVVEGEVMRSGDYCRAAMNTVHGDTYSEAGCLFLLMASQDNAVLG